jgi:hypothetical protein
LKKAFCEKKFECFKCSLSKTYWSNRNLQKNSKQLKKSNPPRKTPVISKDIFIVVRHWIRKKKRFSSPPKFFQQKIYWLLIGFGPVVLLSSTATWQAQKKKTIPDFKKKGPGNISNLEITIYWIFTTLPITSSIG